MAVYRGLVLRDSFARVSDSRITIVDAGPENMTLEFPENIQTAYVQATNWFPGDRITFQAITVYTSSQSNHLRFERLRNGNGIQSTGWFSFEVNTDRDESTSYKEG